MKRLESAFVTLWVVGTAAAVMCPAAETTIKIKAGADAYVDQWVPSTNFGKLEYLRVSNGYGSGGQCKWEKRSLVWFDLSAIPSGATIRKAKLYLYYCGYWDTSPAGRTLRCNIAWGGFVENSVTWNTRPSWGGYTAISTVPSSYGWMSWDVTSDFRWYYGYVYAYGWGIHDDTYWGQANIPVTIFYSREKGSSYAPYLEVTYTTGNDGGPGDPQGHTADEVAPESEQGDPGHQPNGEPQAEAEVGIEPAADEEVFDLSCK